MFRKPGTLWIGCTRDALPLLGYVQYLGDLPEATMGILPFWAIYEKDLPWTWTDKNLPLDESPAFKENLEWGLSLLSRVDKKHWITKEL